MAEVNQTIAGYRLRTMLQLGQKTQVFEVVEPTSGRHFAMKVLLPEHAQSAEARRELFNDAEVGLKMRHENVINILKVSKSESQPFFIMEFFPSGSLRARLMSKDPRDKQFLKEHAKSIFRQVATGLAYMNASGYVHCDLKPDNILSNALGQTKVIDFAISKKIKSGFFAKLLHKRGKPQGTPSFMSPEQILDHMLDGRADIYSYGATLFELVCGRPPFRGSSTQDLLRKHLTEKPPPAGAYNPDVTDEFSAFLTKLLAKKKEDRPPGFHQVLMDLKKVKVFKSVAEKDEDR